MNYRPEFPFKNFKKNKTDYIYSYYFWRSCFEHALEVRSLDWEKWIKDPFRDGNSIFSVVNKKLNRGVIIQQVKKRNDSFWFKCWMSKMMPDEDRDGVEFLFIETFISSDSWYYFYLLCKKWSNKRNNFDYMSDLTENVMLQAQEKYEKINFEWDSKKDID